MAKIHKLVHVPPSPFPPPPWYFFGYSPLYRWTPILDLGCYYSSGEGEGGFGYSVTPIIIYPLRVNPSYVANRTTLRGKGKGEREPTRLSNLPPTPNHNNTS